MVTTLRNGAPPLRVPQNPKEKIENGGSGTIQTPKISEYEQTREKRIKENLERMQKLGIFDLSLKLKAEMTPLKTIRKRKFNGGTLHIRPLQPTRRSSRLRSATPTDYSEKHMVNGSRENENSVGFEGSRLEVYTEEHKNQLGSTDKSWTLFVDGYRKDGSRIYDPIKGKTCHQCRQKTLGHRTQCSQCNKVQGQFCGDCLYMRYGEHVIEAKENPKWICPVCRGICNCSLCRQAKGWAPTGQLYKKVSHLGYKSVAHYLIETQGPDRNSAKDSATRNPTSAKKSLSFSDTDAQFENLSELREGPECGENRDDKCQTEKEKLMHAIDKNYIDGNVASLSNPRVDFDGNVDPGSRPVAHDISVHIPDMDALEDPQFSDNHPILEPGCDDSTDRLKGEEKETPLSPLLDKVPTHISSGSDSIAARLKQRRRMDDNEHGKELMECEKAALDSILGGHSSFGGEAIAGAKVLVATEDTPAPKRKKRVSLVNEQNPDSIAGRLKQGRHMDGSEHGGKELMECEKAALDSKLGGHSSFGGEAISGAKVLVATEDTPAPKRKKRVSLVNEQNPDSIAERLKQRRHMDGSEHGGKELMECEKAALDSKLGRDTSFGGEAIAGAKVLVATEGTPTSKRKKRVSLVNEQNPDSVAARLKQRRRMDVNEHGKKELMECKKSALDSKLGGVSSFGGESISGAKVLVAAEDTPALKQKKRVSLVNEQNPDSIAGRLKQRRHMDGSEHGGKELMECEKAALDSKLGGHSSFGGEAIAGAKVLVATEDTPAPKRKKRVSLVNEQNPDCIAGRLRERRRKEA